MIEIDWNKDYQSEFICPDCNALGMNFVRKHYRNNILGVIFSCPKCRKNCKAPYSINIIPIADPTNPGVVWYKNHKIKGFICPDCQSENIYFAEIAKDTTKKRFLCRSCSKRYSESVDLTFSNISRMNGASPAIKIFNFDEDKWDLRAINPNFDIQDLALATRNFAGIYPIWFKINVKNYIYYLCRAEKNFQTIASHLSSLMFFSRYLHQTKITTFDQINRDLFLDYLATQKKAHKYKIGGLRSFFTIGTVKGWFNIDPDIIRDEDYPKEHRGNPDPLSDIVRQQIEQNLHKLPDAIARMWIICYFTAMRPSELALLQQNCLIQEGKDWKLVWHRKKGNDYHEVPVSRTIAKVVQEQQEYIQNLWGSEWKYLFCHYQNLSKTNLLHPELKPVKKVIPVNNSIPLLVAIRCLIQACDIRDENGQLASFNVKLLRSTRLTQLFEQGHDLAVVSAWAGHRHLATTSTYYTKVSCELMEREAGHICRTLVNSEGHHLPYESFPKSFWSNPQAHKLELAGTHINTPIYGACLLPLDLPLDQQCNKFRACYTCRQHFVATPEKLPLYIKTRDELRAKESIALTNGQDVLVEQFGRQADQLDKIITGLQEAA